MSELVGIGVSRGVATGPVVRLALPPAVPVDEPAGPAGDPAAEAERAVAALEAVAVDLEGRAARASGPAVDVLGAQVLMARDPSLADGIADLARQGRSAPRAVYEALAAYRELLAAAGPYLAERVADLDDLRDRAVAWLLGQAMPGVPDPGHPFVLVARDLAPADTATLDPSRVLALITEQGGPTSHTAILAKSLGIPAVVACPAAAGLVDGRIVVVDGDAGRVTPDPSPAVLAEVAARVAARMARRSLSSGPGRTADGHPVKLLVNVGSAGDVAAAAAVDSEGIGLFRTEFLFLGRTEAPTADEQEGAYRTVFEAFRGRKVVVRTLDAGADKPLPFANPDQEANPALGVRGLHVARRHPELLATQLHAIARAAKDTDAELWVMAPMVSTPAEAAGFVQACRVQGLVQAGAMVEVPAAALRAGDLLEEVDFVSIGTNDLAQYAFAADRMVGELADLNDTWQPALLELVAMTARAARAAGKPVSVCGEAASDPLLALVLTGLGVTSLSMAPASVADVRDALAAHTLDECRVLAELALAATTPDGARAAVTGALD